MKVLVIGRWPTQVTCPKCGSTARRWTRKVSTEAALRYICLTCVAVLNVKGEKVEP